MTLAQQGRAASSESDGWTLEPFTIHLKHLDKKNKTFQTTNHKIAPDRTKGKQLMIYQQKIQETLKTFVHDCGPWLFCRHL